jgi:hypothetical protein
MLAEQGSLESAFNLLTLLGGSRCSYSCKTRAEDHVKSLEQDSWVHCLKDGRSLIFEGKRQPKNLIGAESTSIFLVCNMIIVKIFQRCRHS